MGVLSRKAAIDKNRRWWSVYYSSVLFICFLYWLTVYLKSEAHIIVMGCSGPGWAGLGWAGRAA